MIRLMISDRAEGSARDALQRVLLGDPKSAGYEAFRAGMAEYVAALPPNSHGEANPADKDPVPAPFDNTYNSPEHDAFVMSVKYQRNDAFFTANMVDGDDRARLEQAWNDLFGSWPYHDAYLGLLADHYKLSLKSRHVRDLDAAQIAALPAEARPHFQALRTHYDAVMKAQASAATGTGHRCARVCQPRVAAPADRSRAGGTSHVLSGAARPRSARSRSGPARAHRARPRLAGVPLSRRNRRPWHRAAAHGMGAGEPPELFPLVVRA